MTLTITAGGTPQAGKFFEDIGYYAIRGIVSSHQASTKVQVYWWSSAEQRFVQSAALVTTAGGAYAFNQPVGHYGTVGFRTTLGGVPGTPGTIRSNGVLVPVANASLTMAKPVTSIDALKNPTISGSVFPARAGVKVDVDVVASGRWVRAIGGTTDAAGRFKATFAYGKAKVATYDVRSSYRAANRPRTEVSHWYKIKRTRVLNAVVTKTTSAEVAKTYRSGCPVGPSKLRTITMNFYGFDKVMHRGVMILRTDLTAEAIRAFGKALDAGYPIDKMDNPNVYGGNDPKQMAANNTSGFNCRKVVGNPYSQSPHSYGIALDVNTVQNPYRDRNGKWWPANGKAYIDRSPLKRGMLGSSSPLTKQLTKDDFFWGGRWNPGRDYQHFEYAP